MEIVSKARMSDRIPELDAVRGIAVMLVIVSHAFATAGIREEHWIAKLASYGSSGVDLFFVLSGFLITGILLNTARLPGYFRNFYTKRALRIWPLYFLLLLVSFELVPLLIHYFHLATSELALLESKSKLVYILLLQNLWYPPAPGAAPILLAVTWSLAIEEQFYIVWPWLVLLCSRKKLAYILGTLLFLSPWIRLWATRHGVSGYAIYAMTWFRLDALSLGALIAVWTKSDFFSPSRMKWLSLTALMAGVPASLWLLGARPEPLLSLRYSALALASAGLMTFAIWCWQTNSIFGRPLRGNYLRYIGKVSYCLYLVHLPVYYFLASRLARKYIGSGVITVIPVMVLGFVVSLGIASLSWSMFESQILKLKSKLEYRPQPV